MNHTQFKRLVYILIFSLMYNSQIISQLSEQSSVSILTCKPGDEIYSMYGHTAVRISDPVTQKDEVYNYGLFNFSEPNFTMKFLRGKLLYHLGITNSKRFSYQYTQQKRSIVEQVLNLSLDQRNAIYRALLENMKPENRSYKYDFFFDNCSTRIYDLLKDNIVGLEYPVHADEDYTFRGLLDEYTYTWPWTDFGQDLIVGSVSDQKAETKGRSFLPEFFYDVLDKSTIGHQPLVSKTAIFLDFEADNQRRREKVSQVPIWVFSLLLLVELLLLIFCSKATYINSRWLRILDNLWFSLLGIGSLIILFMWIGTDHLTTKKNLNLLWMSPLFLPYLFKKSKGLTLILAISIPIALILSPFVQELHICAILIMIATLFKLIRQYHYLKPESA